MTIATWLYQSVQRASGSCQRQQALDLRDKMGRDKKRLEMGYEDKLTLDQLVRVREQVGAIERLVRQRNEDISEHQRLIKAAGQPVGIDGLCGDLLKVDAERFDLTGGAGNEVRVDVERLWGTTYYRRVMDVIDKRLPSNMNRTASGDQRVLMQAAINSIMPLLYDGRTDQRLPDRSSTTTPYDSYGKQICEHLGMDYDCPPLGVAFSCARQVGKTEALVMLVFALLVSVPGLKVIVMSTGQRISTMFANRLKAILSMFPELAGMSDGNSERMVFSTSREFTSPMASTVYFCPANPDGLRGLEGDILIFDEMSHMDKRVPLAFGFPLLKKYGRRAWIISTPGGGVNNLFNDIVAAGNKSGFKVIVFEGACRSCARDARFSKDGAVCPHRKAVHAPWSDENAEKALAEVYKLGYGQLYYQEILGAMVLTVLPSFNRDDVERAFSLDRVYRHSATATWCPPEVFLAIDPSGGGQRSETAVVSAFFTPDGTFVVSSHALQRRRVGCHPVGGSQHEAVWGGVLDVGWEGGGHVPVLVATEIDDALGHQPLMQTVHAFRVRVAPQQLAPRRELHQPREHLEPHLRNVTSRTVQRRDDFLAQRVDHAWRLQRLEHIVSQFLFDHSPVVCIPLGHECLVVCREDVP